MALFEQTLESLQSIDDIFKSYCEKRKARHEKGKVNSHLPRLPKVHRVLHLAGKFHLLMTHGATFERQGRLRRDFYKKVLAKAQNRPKNVSTPCVTAIASHFIHFMTQKTPEDINSQLVGAAKSLTKFAVKEGQKAVVLALDEVHGFLHRSQR